MKLDTKQLEGYTFDSDIDKKLLQGVFSETIQSDQRSNIYVSRINQDIKVADYDIHDAVSSNTQSFDIILHPQTAGSTT